MTIQSHEAVVFPDATLLPTIPIGLWNPMAKLGSLGYHLEQSHAKPKNFHTAAANNNNNNNNNNNIH